MDKKRDKVAGPVIKNTRPRINTYMKRIDFHERIVYPITTVEGQKDYYKHLNYWRVCYQNQKQVRTPSLEDTLEYMKLQTEREAIYFGNDKESRGKKCRLVAYDTQYDWRPQKSGDDIAVGLISPAGEQLLPDSFADVFTQFDSVNSKPIFIPVSNGKA